MSLLRLLVIVLPLLPASAGASELTVFGAASLSDALTEVGNAYTARSGHAVRFSFAASSTLAAQIEAGAPAQIFVSANEQWMDHLAARGLIVADSRISPIGNELVLIAPAADRRAPLSIDADLDLPGLLGPDDRLAVGDPAHVPAGIYARQALERLQLWTAVEGRLARASDVRGALVLVERGEAPFGIVYASDAALSSRVEIVGRFAEDTHAPISYPFAIVASSARRPAAPATGRAVRALFAFLTGPDALAIYERHGFRRR